MQDLKIRVYGQLIINVISFFCFYLSSILEDHIGLLKLAVYVVVSTFIIWELLRLSIWLVRKKFPGITHLHKRLALVLLSTLIIVAVIPFIKFYIGDLINLYGYRQSGPIRLYDYLRIMGQNIFYCLFITARTC